MTTPTAFLRIDDRLIHGQVIVSWLPEIKPDRLLVVNDRISEDIMRQELMALSVPPEVDLQFFSTTEIAAAAVSDKSFILVSSPKDAWECLQKGIAPRRFNVGGMHSRDDKEEIFEALHVSDDDRRYFELILEAGMDPVFQPTPQNEPMPLGDIL
ncbi:MAG: PTS mannose/fructose/sorbose transporter subunit IIB [Erysipelotrichia bacterium]|nr:PTS sugar transporter subunit IIB [Candidatus Riflebacteria bacterium]NCB37406.1 PTS mannose/fructose/sorbose transporter subunit IIB [Erysipelotrichia bacterium]